MSNLINKAKDALSGNKDHSTTTSGTHGTTTSGQYDNPQSTNAGPHSSNLMNKANPMVDSDRDNRNDPTSRVGGYGTQGTNTGAGTGGGLASGGAGGYGSSHTGTGVTGTHDTAYGGSGVTGSHGTSHGVTGTHGTSGQYDNPKSTNAGPHGSNMMNKLDPKVDSDRDNRNDPTSRVGGYGTQDNYAGGSRMTSTGAGGYGGTHAHDTTTHGTTGGLGGSHGTHAHDTTTHGTAGGLGGSHGTHGTSTGQYDNPRSTNAGPHGSNLMNTADPRVDSDRSRVGGYDTTHTGAGAGTGLSSGAAGGAGGIGGTHGATGTHGTGVGHSTTGIHGTSGVGGTHGSSTQYDNPQSTNAGPHKSNLLNKLDPRVNSDGK